MAERFERVVTLKSDYQWEDVPYGVTSFYRGVEEEVTEDESDKQRV